MHATCAVRIFFVSLLCFVSLNGHVFCDEFMERIGTEELIPLRESLPDYWHQHVEDLKIGYDRDEEPIALCRDEIEVRFEGLESSISAVHLYLPHVRLCRAEPLVFFVIHGTWSSGNPQYFDLNNDEFQATISFVQELAERYAQPVEVVSFRWSGADSIEARQDAGDRLRRVIERHYQPSEGYSAIWSYCHSHGGNVSNIASQDVAFDTVIYCGTPVLEGTLSMYRPMNIKRVFHLYDTSDPIQKAGSFDRRTFHTFFARGDGRVYQTQDDKRIFNMRLQCNARGPGHMAVKNALGAMWDVMDIVEERYHFHNHFDVNISVPQKGRVEHPPMVAIRSSLTIEQILPHIQSGDDGPIVLDQLRREISYSEEQKNAFSSWYGGREISAGDSFFRFFATNWNDFIDACQYHAPWLKAGECLEDSLLDPPTSF